MWKCSSTRMTFGAIAEWVVAMFEYNRVSRAAGPDRELLQQAKMDLVGMLNQVEAIAGKWVATQVATKIRVDIKGEGLAQFSDPIQNDLFD